MASFRYSAIRDSGEKVVGTIEGADRSLAISRLSEQGLHPIDIREDGQGGGAASLMSLATGRIPRQELTGFTRQLAWLLQAGTTLNRSLEILSGETFSKSLAAAVTEVRGSIRKGRSFHDARELCGLFHQRQLLLRQRRQGLRHQQRPQRVLGLGAPRRRERTGQGLQH